MEIPESQWDIIWKAINHWRDKYNLTTRLFSSQISGIRPAYLPDRVARGIKDGSEEITSDLLHECVRIFHLSDARKRGLDDGLTDEECIALLIAPLNNNAQGKFQL